MTGLTVNELVDLLAKEIAAGNGDYAVMVVLNGVAETCGRQTERDLDAHNWRVNDTHTPDHPADRFVVLSAEPE